MASGGGNDQRNPKDMKALLKFCLEATKDEDAKSEEFAPMDEQRKKWLEQALVGMSVSPVQRMKTCIECLNNHQSSEEERRQAMEELIEWGENMDYAIDFHKIGGFDLFPRLLSDEEAEIRWQTLELVACLVQNNPYCQNAVLQNKMLPVLLELLDKDDNSTVKVKALYAVSCLTRDCQEAQKIFTDNDGFSVLMRAMQQDVEKLKIKAAFMLSALCNNTPEYKDILCDIGMIDQLVGHLNEEHSNFHEHVMSAMLAIVRDHPRSVEECQRSELDLHNVLQQRIKFLTGKEQFIEEKSYAEEMLKLISCEDSLGEANR